MGKICREIWKTCLEQIDATQTCKNVSIPPLGQFDLAYDVCFALKYRRACSKHLRLLRWMGGGSPRTKNRHSSVRAILTKRKMTFDT